MKDYDQIKMRLVDYASFLSAEILAHPDHGGYGWGNGYVGVPKGHPWFGKCILELESIIDHDRINFASFFESVADHSHFADFEKDLFWIGFDTCGEEDWDKEYVQRETDRLRQMAIDAWEE